MTSKNLFFKLMKEDLKSRIWAIALLGLGFFFTFPVVVMLRAGTLKNAENYAQELLSYTGEMQFWLSFSNGLVTFIMIMAAIICGMSSFSYLNSKSKVDFYHGLPIRREKLYIANFIDGILIVAVPYAAMLILGMLLAVVNGIKAEGFLWMMLSGYAANMVYYVLLYGLMIVTVMLTGNKVVTFLGMMVFCGIVPAVFAVASSYFGMFFATYMTDQMEDVMLWSVHLSPLAEYIMRVGNYGSQGIMLMPTVLAMVSALLLMVLGGFLYHKRPSEAAGKALAFTVTGPVIRVVLVMVSALSFGMFFWTLESGMPWAIFGICCGGVISHCVIEIIYHFDFKKLFSGKWQLVGCLVASILILCTFRYDWLGYDRYLPKENQIKSVSINLPDWNRWVSYGESVRKPDGSYRWKSEDSVDYVLREMKDVDIAAARQIAMDGIAAGQRIRNEDYNRLARGYYYDGYYSLDEDTYYQTQICYTLNSGRKVYRSYRLPLAQLEQDLASLYTSEAYKTGTYPIMSLTADQVTSVRYREFEPEIQLKDLSEKEINELLTAYQQDLKNMTVEQMRQQNPAGLIRFVTRSESDAMAWEMRKYNNNNNNWYSPGSEDYYYNYGGFSEISFYPVYRSFEQTCLILAKYGIEPGDDFSAYPVDSYTIMDYDVDEKYWAKNNEYPEYIISDPDEIQQLNKVVTASGMSYYNPLWESENVDMTIRLVKKGKIVETSVTVSRQQMPEFLKQRLAENRTKQKGE